MKEEEEEERKPYDYGFPANGENAEQLLELINNESPLDEFLRERRDLERNIMFYKNRIMEMTNTIIQETELMHEYVQELQEVYKKYIDNGSPKENNIHIS